MRPSQSVSTSQSNNPDGVKRRSFLPQRGDLKYISRKTDPKETLRQQSDDRGPSRNPESLTNSNVAVSSRTPEVQSSNAGRLRPRSMYQTGVAGHQHGENGGNPTRLMRPPDAVKSTAPQSASLGRSQSLRKPSAPTQSAQSTSARSHLRTQSTSTVTGVRKASTEYPTQQERPRSLLVPPGNATKAIGKAPADPAVSGIRSSARLLALKRSASTKSKPESAEADESAGSAASSDHDQQVLTASSRRREALREDKKAHTRPAFSTLQQHFTPRKTGKAPTSTFLHPAAPDAGSSTIAPETVGLQIELLQLHLLHQSSANANSQWELSTKKHLHRKFDEVTSLYQVMRENERQGQEQKNIRALRDWSGANSSCGLAEHIQLLSGPLQELPTLVGPDGRFGRLVNEFHQWIAWVEEVWAAREDDAAQRGGVLHSAEGLGDSWKAENATLTRKLTSFSRDLDKLTQPAPGSSIARIVSTCKELVGGILSELQTMQSIEAGVVAKEGDWVEAQLKAIARDIGAHLGSHEGEAAWQM